MYCPKANKLPSGSWRCRVVLPNGKRKSVTAPTKKEAEKQAVALREGFVKTPESDRTVTQAIDAYIEGRDSLLSPATVRGYREIQKLRFQNMKYRKIAEVTDEEWQKAVNDERKLCSAGTLKRSWYFMSSVIRKNTGRTVSVTLSDTIEKEQTELPFLDDKQVVVFMNAIKGHWVEIPALLGLHSLRRSEILAMEWNDIDLEKGCLRVRGASVYDVGNKLVEKDENKNKTSRRTVPFILPQLREAVEKARPKDGRQKVYQGNPNQIYVAVNRICKRNGLPEVGCHGLRRSYASLAYHYNMMEEVAMRAGGWKDIKTMRKIYTKVSEDDMKSEGQKFASHFSSANNGHEIGHDF